MRTPTLANLLYDGPEHGSFVLDPPAQQPRQGSALLLHGFPGSPAEMRALAGHLARSGWLVYAPLLPGLGAEIDRLGATRRQDWVRAARTAGRTLRRRGGPLLLVGYSMGAAVALHTAAAVRADLLLLLAPFWQAADWVAYPLSLLRYLKPEIAPLARADLDHPEIRRVLHLLAPGLDLEDEATRSFLRQDLRVPTAVGGELLQLGLEGYRFAARIKIPTLIVQGTQDEVVLPAATRALMAQMGGPVAYHEVEGDHHFLDRLSAENGPLVKIIHTFIERNLQR